MRTSPVRHGLVAAAAGALLLAGCSTGGTTPSTETQSSGADSATSDDHKYTTRTVSDGKTDVIVVENPNDGATLSYAADGPFELIEVEEDGYTYAFKDMNGNGELDLWEDWRLDCTARGADLAPQLTKEQVSGLTLFSGHERSPSDGLTDAQKEYLKDSYLRNVLYAGGNEVEPVVTWTNQMQAYVETLSADGVYIPANFSSDPRHDAANAYDAKSGGTSQWPSFLGLGATFDPQVVEDFGRYASEEYVAMGLTNALSPQIDLGSDPRWLRINGTFGEDPDMTADMAAAYVTGFQNVYSEDGTAEGWGQGSVSTVIKHFPGDGAGEGGRESHTNAGKFAVMPGDNGEAHLKPFVAAMEAGAGGMMTSYSIITDGEGEPYYGKLMGSAYDQDRLDIARVANNYDGVIVTDWGVTNSVEDGSESFFGMAWGAKDLSVDERHFEILKTGHDQFGGNNDIQPVLAAYDMWQEAFEKGEVDVDADTRWADTGRRVVSNFFCVGLYDNPYNDLDESVTVVGNDEATAAGLAAQERSVVLLKNTTESVSCAAEPTTYKEMTAYVPHTFDTGHPSVFGEAEYKEGPSVDLAAAEEIFGTVITDEVELDDDGKVVKVTAPDLSDVDIAIVGMNNPDNGNAFSSAGLDAETGEFYPLSLQYRPYTADGEHVRKESIAADVDEDGKRIDRSYYGNTSRISNEADLDAFERTVEAVKKADKDIPIVATLRLTSGITIPAEFEKDADIIAVGFSVTDKVLLDVALGITESQGRLPIGMPASMDAVEDSFEDLEKDVDSYVDSEGNKYEFGFGLGCDAQPIK